MDVRARIAELVAAYDLPASAADQFERLLAALAAEPDPHTTLSEPAQAVDQHIADSLSGLELDEVRSALRIVDIGAGAGFPGLPLAIALPGAEIDLLEASRRKAAVIERLAAAAGTTNARALPLRAEEWALAEGRNAYGAATVRAVAPLAVLVEYAAPLLRVGGSLLAWKGHRDPEEESSGAAAAEMVGLRPVLTRTVKPFEGARDLNLHLYSKDRETPERFPRRPGAAAKRPLA
jgi:16S rRNA (guanine527-N7)-methyltransferase